MADLGKISEALRKLASKQLLVGIPSEGDPRPDEPIGNASLGYVFEFGSPAVNIPARPHLVPGVEKAMDEIGARMQAAAKSALDGNSEQAEQYLGQAGQAAVNSVQQMITDKLDPPIKPESYLRRTTGRTARQKRARRGGQTLIDLARAEASQATPLVDTGSYRRSITYVVRDKK